MNENLQTERFSTIYCKLTTMKVVKCGNDLVFVAFHTSDRTNKCI